MSHTIVWLGVQVLDKKRQQAANAMGEVGLRVEAAAKRQLYKGHGVITGTLRRSIHTASPGYNWSGDSGGPDGPAKLVGDKLIVEVGSGLEYAMAVHDGHGSFGGYHYLTIGVDIVRPAVPGIFKEYLCD